MKFAADEPGEILSQDAQGRVLVSLERRELLLEQYDRSGMSGVKFAQYVGIKYSTLAYWLQSRRRHREREKLLMKAGAEMEPGRSNGAWIEAVVEKGSPPRVSTGALRIYFAGGAYSPTQISSAGEAALAAELLGRLGAKR
jgi:transposase